MLETSTHGDWWVVVGGGGRGRWLVVGGGRGVGWWVVVVGGHDATAMQPRRRQIPGGGASFDV